MKAAAWLPIAILSALVIATMAALIVLAIPDMWRDLRAHWRKTGQLAAAPASRSLSWQEQAAVEAIRALINAVTCDQCRTGEGPDCVCDRKCDAPLCPAPDTGVVVFTKEDRRLLRRAGIKGDE